jgi:hypothetical protein
MINQRQRPIQKLVLALALARWLDRMKAQMQNRATAKWVVREGSADGHALQLCMENCDTNQDFRFERHDFFLFPDQSGTSNTK